MALWSHMSQRSCVVWVWRGYKGSRTEQLISSFSYQDSSPKGGAWILNQSSLPSSDSLPWDFRPPWSINPESDLSSEDLEPSLLDPSRGCHPEPNLHQIPLWDTEGNNTDRSSPHRDPEFLQCSDIFNQPWPWPHNSHRPSLLILTPCMYLHDENNPLQPVTVSYTVSVV